MSVINNPQFDTTGEALLAEDDDGELTLSRGRGGHFLNIGDACHGPLDTAELKHLGAQLIRLADA